MARFDVFANPSVQSTFPFYVDVQSDFVHTATRWCIPMYQSLPAGRILRGIQAPIQINMREFVLDTANLLAVPAALLRKKSGHLAPDEQLTAEGCIEFMLRGY